MIAKKLIVLGLLLVGGCMTEPPKWKFSPGTDQQVSIESAPGPQDQVKHATEKSKDASRNEKERQMERVQRALDKIKKESREEYAASRPYPIKDSILKEQLCLGMDDRDVLVCLGQPERKTRTVTRHGVRDTWAYMKLNVWFEDGVVMGWREEE